MASTKAVGSPPSAPSGRPMIRILFLLFLFSASSALYSRAFTLVWRVRRTPSDPLSRSPPALFVAPYPLLWSRVYVLAYEAHIELYRLYLGGKGHLARCYSCHHLR